MYERKLNRFKKGAQQHASRVSVKGHVHLRRASVA
jgi:hypothetical protein